MTRLGNTARFAFTAALLAPGVVHAQQRLADDHPLERAVTEALRNSPALAQERALVDRAEAEVGVARARYFPSLTVDGRYTEQEGALNLGDIVNPAYSALNQITGETRFPTDLDLTLPLRHESRLRLVQPVFDARIRAGHAASRYARDGQSWQRRAAARRLAADAQTALVRVASARSARRILEAAVPLVRENERVSQRLVDAGRATPDAVFSARAERSDIEQQVLAAREGEHAAERSFNRVLGRDLDTPVEELPDSLLQFALTIDEEQAVESALAGREELKQVEAGIGEARAGVRAATAELLPSVSVALDYGVQGQEIRFAGDADFWAASVVFSWNVFDGGGDLARRQGARADVNRLRERQRETEDLIRLDVRQAHEAVVVACDAIATAEARLAAARRAFELVRRRHEEGVATQVEFLDARSRLTSAELGLSLANHGLALRWIDLERAAALRELQED